MYIHTLTDESDKMTKENPYPPHPIANVTDIANGNATPQS